RSTTGKKAAKKEKEVLAGQAYLAVDRLPAGGKCRVLVQLQVADGWHVHANPPGDAEIDIATEVEIDSKLDVELKNLRYPAGKKVDRGPDEKPQLLYTGKVSVFGEIE